MGESDVLSLLMQLKQELDMHKEDGHMLPSKAEEEYIKGCWQLCNLGCDPGDKLCIEKQCNYLCQAKNLYGKMTELSQLDRV